MKKLRSKRSQDGDTLPVHYKTMTKTTLRKYLDEQRIILADEILNGDPDNNDVNRAKLDVINEVIKICEERGHRY